LSENIVGQTFEDEMRKTKGKFIMTTFSSNISRIRQCVEAAIKFNRKIIFLGRSMKENTRLSQEIGYLPIPYTLIAKEEELVKIPPNKLCMIVAGSQGQYNSALSKLADKQNHFVRIKPGDKIIFSSDPIPGNESEVYSLIEDLSMQGADVVYSDIQDQLHASGHGNKEDLKYLIRFTDPKYFIPIGGTIRHQRQYQKMVEEMGYKKETVFMLQEGETIWFTKNHAQKGDRIETKNIYVDAYGIGDVGNMVLRDRKMLATDGIVMALLIIDNQIRLITKPKIVSKGFVYEKGEEVLFSKATDIIQKTMKPKARNVINLNRLKKEIITDLEDFFFKERGRKPLIIVEIVQI
jgi:ribonuclease J